jgi:DNA mismatch endonuclease, patch repair protein
MEADDRKNVRSRMMAAIKAKNTRPERQLRRILHAQGYRFRLHRKDLAGRPDIVLPKYRLAIFVHGCFWHQHENCKYAVQPKSNLAFWTKKLNANTERDTNVLRHLWLDGWRTMVVWECELKEVEAQKRLAAVISKLVHSPALHVEYGTQTKTRSSLQLA